MSRGASSALRQNLLLLSAWLSLLRPMNLVLLAVTPLALWASLVMPLQETPALTARQVLMLGGAIAAHSWGRQCRQRHL